MGGQGAGNWAERATKWTLADLVMEGFLGEGATEDVGLMGIL